jgi:hypothetical protein
LGIDQRIGEPPFKGLLAVDPASGVEHHRRSLPSDDQWQRVGDTEAGMNSQLHKICREAGIARCLTLPGASL